MLPTELHETPESIIAACHAAMELAPVAIPPDLPPTAIVPDIPAWYGFETAAWGIGETIRHSLKARPRLKKDSAVLRAIFEVVQYRNLRRGRESFVMLLGFTGAAEFAPMLAPLVDDPDISGHVVDTLLKMRASGHGAQVAKLATHHRAWIRRLAHKYLDRYPIAA